MKRYLLFIFFLFSFSISRGQYIFVLSPNGGETYAIGSSQSITWASIGINQIDIEYSSNNGNTYITIDTSVQVFSNNYTWQVPGPVTSNGLIRLKESTTGNLIDISDATFNVVNPSVSITFPTLSTIFNPGQQTSITWNGLLVSNFVSLLFSSDNGVSYDTIASNIQNFYSYDWIVPSVASNNCKIKIIDAAAPTVQNTSATFSIEALPSTGTVLTPNGGENLFSTTTYNITWNVSGTNIIDLEYTSDGGNNWLSLAQNLPSTPANFQWTVPSLNSNNAKVRIKNAINGLVLDESNNVFSITQPTPTLYLSSPFGYENWAVGSVQPIQWIFTFVSSLKIEYSTNGGTSYNLIANNVPASNLSYNWTIPAGVSSNCLIKITDNNSAVTSQNQNPFSIVNPSIVLLSPNGGEVFNSNVDTIITWNGNLISNLVKLEFTTNNGNTWNLIANNVVNTNFYHWFVPNFPSTNCKVRVSDAQNPSVIDQSNAVFTITAPTPILTLVTPNGGEQWAIGTNQTISWNSVNVANVKIEYSSNNGSTWNIISSLEPAANGNYTWLVNAPVSVNTLIKVSNAANTNINDVSSNVFEVFAPSSFIDLLNPNGGEQLAAGLNTSITWNAQSISSIAIEYSIDNGLNWISIATGISASLGTYDWNVPFLITNTLKIRIRDEVNSSLFDQSSGNVNIIIPSIELTSFPNGASFTLFSNLNILWMSNGLNNQLLRLEYSINNGNSWVTFATGVPNTGSYNWLINCPPTPTCKVKISVENQVNVQSISQGSIAIISNGPSIVVLTPTSSETVSSGGIYPITWNSYAINYVRLEYSLNGDTIFQLITPFTPASTGLFNWSVPPNINATNCKIKISNAANINLSALSPQSFNIQSVQYYVASGNSGGNIIFAGDNYPINWSSNSNSGYVNIEYSTDSINWNTIINNYQNSGEYFWSVPYINADSVWFKVSDYLNSNFTDVNDVPQKILIADSLLELNNPASSAVLLVGSNSSIQWTALGINTIDIEFSADSGSTWITIANNINASLSLYNWIVPNTFTNKAFIRIKNSSNPLQFAQNQFAFTISDALLNITSPNGGQSWSNNTSYYITWQSLGVNFIDLYYSSDGGSNYTLIDTNVYNIGYYNWLTPAINGQNFKIKIIDSNNPFFSDESDANFSLNLTSASISVNTPNGGEQLISNSGTFITWQSSGISNIDINLSLDGGTTYSPIATNIAATPSYFYWFVADTTSNNAKIKISSSSNNAINDISNGNFTIINNTPQLHLLYPNGNEVFNSNSFQTIKWSAANTPFVKLYYSTNGGVSYTYINSVLNDSTYIWQVPQISSNNCKIKVENGNNPSLFDATSTLFFINNQPLSSNSVSIDSLTNSNLCSGSIITISYNINGTFNLGNNFRVHLSNFNGNFSSFADIGGVSDTASGTIQCLIPEQSLSGSLYTLRIVSDNPATISNYNFGNITINKANADFVSDKQLVIFPNTSVNFEPNASIASISNSNWNMGDGSNYTAISPQHSYSVAGKYNITHNITDTIGCTASKTAIRMINVEHWFPNLEITTNSIEELVDISFENPRYGCALFKNGNCLVTSDSGKTWTLSYTNYNSNILNSITTVQNAWYIAANNGAYLKSTNRGLNWIPFTFNNYESLRDIIFTSSSNAYAVGNNGKLLNFNGTNWINQNSGVSENLNQIANKNNTTIAVGNNGSIVKQVNNSWTTIAPPVLVNLNGISLKDSLNGYIVGDFGFILKTNDGGNSWSVALAGADVNFKSVAFSGDTIWAVGSEGTIYTSLNNGTSWNRYSIGISKNLNSIIYTGNKGFIVGESGLLRTFNYPQYVFIPNSVQETLLENTINIYPNPTKDIINISYRNQKLNDYFNINISDIQGRWVEEKRIQISSSNGQSTIDLSELRNGIYFVNIMYNNQQQTFKIVKAE